MSNTLYGGKILISETGVPIQLDAKTNNDTESAKTAEAVKHDDTDLDVFVKVEEEDNEAEEEEFLCPICQGGEDETDSFAKLAECEHVFCEPCITEWSKNANTCPICRNRFDHLCTCKSLHGDFSTKVKIEYKSSKESVVDLDHYMCQICHSGENEELLLLCDGCDEAYHTFCLTPRLESIPDGDWFCVACSGGGEEEEGEQGLDINPGTGSIQFRLPSSTRRLAMEELLRRTRRTTERRNAHQERRRSSSISQAVQLISSITGRARTAKGAKLARIATRTVGIHTLRGLRKKRSKSRRRTADKNDWSPPIRTSPERLEAWNKRDEGREKEVAGFSKAALEAHKAHKSESVLGARRFFQDAQPGPSRATEKIENPTPPNLLDLITTDIINSTSKTATVDKKGDIVYKTREEVLKEEMKITPKPTSPELPARISKVKIDEGNSSSKNKHNSDKRSKTDKSMKKPKKSKKVKKERRSRSRSYSSSPCRRKSLKSDSPKRRKPRKSVSPSDRKSDKSESPRRRKSSNSESPRRRKSSKSESPVRRKKDKSESPVRREKDKSESPVRREKNKSESPVRRKKDKSESPVRRKSESQDTHSMVEDEEGKVDKKKLKKSKRRVEVEENNATLSDAERKTTESPAKTRESPAKSPSQSGEEKAVHEKEEGEEERGKKDKAHEEETLDKKNDSVAKPETTSDAENDEVFEKSSPEKSSKEKTSKEKTSSVKSDPKKSKHSKKSKRKLSEKSEIGSKEKTKVKEAKKEKRDKENVGENEKESRKRKKSKDRKKKKKLKSKDKVSSKEKKSVRKSRSMSSARSRTRSRSRSRARSVSRSRKHSISRSRTRSNSLHIIENLRDKYRDEGKSSSDKNSRSSSRKIKENRRQSRRNDTDSEREDRRYSRRKDSDSERDSKRKKPKLDEFGRDETLRKSPNRSLEILKGSIRLNDIPSPANSGGNIAGESRTDTAMTRERVTSREGMMTSRERVVSGDIAGEFTGVLGSLDDVYSPGDESPLDDVWPTKTKTVEEEAAIPASGEELVKSRENVITSREKEELPSITAEKSVIPGFVNTMQSTLGEAADSDDMIIASGGDTDNEQETEKKEENSETEKSVEKDKNSPSPLINTVSDLVIKMKQAEEINKANEKSPSPKTPDFLVKVSTPVKSPEYEMTPPQIQEERRKERVRKQAESEKKHSRSDKNNLDRSRRKRSSDGEKRRRSSTQDKRSTRHSDCVKSTRSGERRRSESSSKRSDVTTSRDVITSRKRTESSSKRSESRRKRSDSKKQSSDQEKTRKSEAVIPLLDESPPPPPPPPPRGSVLVVDHGESAAAIGSAALGGAALRSAALDSPVSSGHSGDSAPLVYINNNTLPSKHSHLANNDFSNGSMVRKRARLDPPVTSSPSNVTSSHRPVPTPSTLSVTDIMGSPSVMLGALNDSYALEQFNDAWTKEAQSPTSYSEPGEKVKEAEQRETRDKPDRNKENNTPTDPRGLSANPLKMIMESIGRGMLDTIGSDDMDIEEDDIPPPPPPEQGATNNSQVVPQSPSTTPLHPPPTTKMKGRDKKEKVTIQKEKVSSNHGNKEKAAGNQGNKEKVKEKVTVQQEIASIVKLALKVPYKKKKINKEEYKSIMKQVVSKVYESRHVKRGDQLRPDKITEMVAVYIKQSKHQRAKVNKEIKTL